VSQPTTFTVQKVRLLFALFLGCCAAEEPPSRQSQSLASPNLWEITYLHLPPFPEQPDDAFCDSQGYTAELLGGVYVFSVLTEFCNYITVTQPSQTRIQTGDSVKLRFWHSQLTAPVNSLATAGLLIDKELIWREQYNIPLSNSSMVTFEWTATQNIPTGTPLFFHVSNHGNNEYSLVELTLIPYEE